MPQKIRVSCLGGVALLLAALAWAGDGGPDVKKAAPPDPRTLPPPKRTVVPKLHGAVTVDGRLDEPMWRDAASLGPLVPANGIDAPREESVIRIWYDDTALYLGWTCRDADIQATFTARDSRFWEEEVAEFFITRQDLTRYFELQWNPLGGVFDAVIYNQLDERGASKGIKGEWGYTAQGMRSAVTVKGTVADGADRDEYWQVEVVIPFADLETTAPKPGEVWRANFYRFNRGSGQPVEQLSWSPPMMPGFHQPARFGFLTFGK